MHPTAKFGKSMDGNFAESSAAASRPRRQSTGTTGPSPRITATPRKRRLAGLEAAQGLGTTKSSEKHKVPISTVQRWKKKFKVGALPEPPADLFDSVEPPLVSVPNPTDRRGVLTVYAVYLSGRVNKVRRDSKAMRGRAVKEMAALAAKFVARKKGGKAAADCSAISMKVLTSAIAHHWNQRKLYMEERGNSRVPYEYICRPQRRGGGRPSIIPFAMGLVLEMWVKACRMGKLKVSQGIVRAKMKSCLEEVPHLAEVKVSTGWHYRWLSSTTLESRVVRELDITRAKWLTSKNVKIHNDVVMEAALEAGLAVKKGEPGYELFADILPDGERAQDFIYGDESDTLLCIEYIRWKFPYLLVSLDETRISTMGKGEKQSNGLADGPDDHGECLTLRGGKAVSMMGGIFGDHTAAPPMCVYNSGESASGEWGRSWPACKFGHNEKGSFNEKWFSMYMKEVLYPELLKRGCGKDGQKAMVVLDGVITHCSHQLITWCHSHFIILVLRPPNTSSATQPEDVVLFKQLKQTWVDFKNTWLFARILELGEASLSWEDVVEGAKLAWETAFTYRLIRKSWRAVGILPFTRRVEIKLRRKEAKAEEKRKSQPVKVMTLNTGIDVVSILPSFCPSFLVLSLFSSCLLSFLPSFLPSFFLPCFFLLSSFSPSLFFFCCCLYPPVLSLF